MLLLVQATGEYFYIFAVVNSNITEYNNTYESWIFTQPHAGKQRQLQIGVFLLKFW